MAFNDPTTTIIRGQCSVPCLFLCHVSPSVCASASWDSDWFVVGLFQWCDGRTYMVGHFYPIVSCSQGTNVRPAPSSWSAAFVWCAFQVNVPPSQQPLRQRHLRQVIVYCQLFGGMLPSETTDDDRHRKQTRNPPKSIWKGSFTNHPTFYHHPPIDCRSTLSTNPEPQREEEEGKQKSILVKCK